MGQLQSEAAEMSASQIENSAYNSATGCFKNQELLNKIINARTHLFRDFEKLLNNAQPNDDSFVENCLGLAVAEVFRSDLNKFAETSDKNCIENFVDFAVLNFSRVSIFLGDINCSYP